MQFGEEETILNAANPGFFYSLCIKEPIIWIGQKFLDIVNG